MSDLIEQYRSYTKSKSLALKTVAKYKAELDKLSVFVRESRITQARDFDECQFYAFRQWLEQRRHKHGTTYSAKSIYTTLTLCKQVFKWARQRKLLNEYALAGVEIPKAQAKPQPCFTTEQVEKVVENTTGEMQIAFAVLAYSGMRVGELEQLEWRDVILDRGELGMFHIRRGGSGVTTKDKDERFVPIHPRIRPMIDAVPKSAGRVLPSIRSRQLLAESKVACKNSGFTGNYKVHSFRHHFASMCANHHIAFKKALTWLGHSSSDMLDLYYHLHDAESEAAMVALADSHPICQEQQRAKTIKNQQLVGRPRSENGQIWDSFGTQGVLQEYPKSETPVPQTLTDQGSNETERAGSSRSEIRNLLTKLELVLNTLSESNLDDLRKLLVFYGFLRS